VGRAEGDSSRLIKAVEVFELAEDLLQLLVDLPHPKEGGADQNAPERPSEGNQEQHSGSCALAQRYRRHQARCSDPNPAKGDHDP